MAQVRSVKRQAAAKLLIEHPERLAAAWRRERFAASGKETLPESLIDGCVESFVREIGYALGGVEGPAWTRAKGVLRLCLSRCPSALHEEFGALRRCLLDALQVVDAPPAQQHQAAACIDEAISSCFAACRKLETPRLPGPRIPFGGLVVELIEPRPRPHAVAQQSWPAAP